MYNTNEVLGVDPQCNKLAFKPSAHNSKVFDIRNKNGPLGWSPTVMTNFCPLPPNGKKGEELRGIVSYPTRVGGGTFSKLKLVFTDETAGDVIKMCLKTLEAWKDAYDPVRKSMWYQTTFGLLDGTQVHLATGAIVNPEIYNSYVFPGVDRYNAPSETFFNALYGDEENAPWYETVGIPVASPGAYNENDINSAVLVFRGEDGKHIKTKLGQDCPSIPNSGVPLTDVDTIRKIEQSKWYKESRWQCKTAIQLRSLEWKISTDSTSGDRVLYPIFHLKTNGSIVFQRTEYTLPEGVVPVEQRAAVLNAALFEGMEAPPVKKRKRVNPVTDKRKKGVSLEGDFEQEILLGSDIEGENSQ